MVPPQRISLQVRAHRDKCGCEGEAEKGAIGVSGHREWSRLKTLRGARAKRQTSRSREAFGLRTCRAIPLFYMRQLVIVPPPHQPVNSHNLLLHFAVARCSARGLWLAGQLHLVGPFAQVSCKRRSLPQYTTRWEHGHHLQVQSPVFQRTCGKGDTS